MPTSSPPPASATARAASATRKTASASTSCAVPDDPNRFYLYEVYANREAHATHREQPHYVAWRSAVEHMFDGDLGRVEMETVFPSDDGWRAQKPGLVNW